MKVCHVTSAHSRYDGRIFLKQLISLSKNYDCYLVCCDDLEDEIKNNINIKSTHRKFKNRYERFLKSKSILKKKCLEVDADVYQFHDVDLLNLAYEIKKLGKKVIFDAHEDYEALFLEREWIPTIFRKILLKNFINKEKKIYPKLDYIICAADHIEEKIKKYNSKTITIENFPILEEPIKKTNNKNNIICFAGSIRADWNHENIIKSINKIKNITYKIAGNYSEQYYNDLSIIDGFSKVKFLGRKSYKEVRELYKESKIGMALCSYLPNTGNKRGSFGNTKIFEYMMNELPIVFTDFDIYCEINKNKKFGIPVNPYNVGEIKEAIEYILNNPKEAENMGKNGRYLVEKKYNWEILEKKLLGMYKKL